MAVKVLHFSTHNENCGIGKYQEMFLEQLEHNPEVENKFFELSPNEIRIMDDASKQSAFRQLADELKSYDILHIQHEFSFYRSDEFRLACLTAVHLKKKLAVTIHTAPSVAYSPARLAGRGPRSVLHYLRMRKREKFFTKNFAEPLAMANMVLVHNQVTKSGLIGIGVAEACIESIVIPVPSIDQTLQTNEIALNLHKQAGDIIYATTGFLHKYKGIDHAIKALSYLPKNYKLAVIGGMHQDHEHEIYNDLTDLIVQLGLVDRVYITGYVADDNRMNALIRECDMCVYPYEKVYYSNVSSAALNNAFTNFKPVIGYPTASFKEINSLRGYMVLTQAFSYYELAREIRTLDLREAESHSKSFAADMSLDKIAAQVVKKYEKMLTVAN